MSKYIIEIPDYVPYVLLRGDACGKFITKVVPVAELEKLNSDYDYINEHFGSLQDEAYQRGLAEGKKAFDLLDTERDAEYQKGFEDGKNSIDNGCKGCKYEDQHGYDEPCNNCLHAHVSHYTPMPKYEICFGDEIVVNGERGVVVSHENEGSATIWALLNGYRTPQIVHKNNYTKTGRCFDMAGIMEAVKNG